MRALHLGCEATWFAFKHSTHLVRFHVCQTYRFNGKVERRFKQSRFADAEERATLQDAY